MQSLAEMVKPGGTGRPRFAISASPAPLPPRMSRMAAEPSARPSPKEYTHRSSAGTSDHLGMAARSGAALRARLADQLDQRPAGRAADDRVVHDHHLLPLEHFPNGIELDFDFRHAAGLGGMDERAADVVIADERVLELDPRFLGEAERHGVG